MIEINDLTKQFGEILAVDHINLSINDGEVFGFLGPNGAGKTTTIRMLSCLLKPTLGTALINGYDILLDSMKIRKIIGVLTENPSIYERLTARYNLEFFGKLYEVPNDVLNKRIDELLNIFDLIDRADDKVSTFSKGMKQKLSIARTLVHNPEILFLDEPTAGLDPKASKDLRDYIKKLSKERNITIFLCSHNLTEAEYLCDRIAVINNGRIISEGTPKELSRKLWSYERTEVKLAENYLNKISDPNILINEIKSISGVDECYFEDSTLKIFLESAEKINPEIIRKLISLDLDLIEVKVIGHSLEDIYLSLITDESKSSLKI